jgi:hypothetical protein
VKTLLVALLLAAPTAPAVRAEIDQLLGRLEASGCRFNRNGSWHPAAEAKSHLLRKLEYVEGRSGVASAEQFIALAASRSSVSGKPYLVECAPAQAVESAAWLTSQLREMRGGRP